MVNTAWEMLNRLVCGSNKNNIAYQKISAK